MTVRSKHILPDVLAPNLKVVFCGSAAGWKSAELGMPYAGPGNKFWPTLYAAGFTPTLWHPSDFKKLPSLGYGLTDINKTEFGMDVDLTNGDDPGALRRKIIKYQPRILAFTAKRPAMVFLARKKLDYGFQEDMVGATRLYVLPSPSGRAGSFWNIETWRMLADAVK
jgi:TDG/mug DNA glycosylase family protein